jgi:hypothetical protein
LLLPTSRGEFPARPGVNFVAAKILAAKPSRGIICESEIHRVRDDIRLPTFI